MDTQLLPEMKEGVVSLTSCIIVRRIRQCGTVSDCYRVAAVASCRGCLAIDAQGSLAGRYVDLFRVGTGLDENALCGSRGSAQCADCFLDLITN